MTGGGGKASVTREQRRVEHLGEGHIHRLVGRQVIPQFPYPRQKEIVRISVQTKIGEVSKRRAAAFGVDITVGRVSAYHLRDFDVDQMRCV